MRHLNIAVAILTASLLSFSWSFHPRIKHLNFNTVVKVEKYNDVFLNSRSCTRNSHHNRLLALRSSSIDDLMQDGKFKVINDFPQFLNQASIQSLIFLVNSLRDRHTAIWLEDFTQPVIRTRTKDKASDEVLSKMANAMKDAMQDTKMEREIKLLTYHGLGAINTTLFPTWESYLEKMLHEESVTYTIESTRPHVPSYEMEINPASLCTRLVSVREQIAREWIHELDAILEMTDNMLHRYKDGVLEKPNLFFLENSVHEDFTPSPLRKGNFDLLVTLTTQEAVHRVLNTENINSKNMATIAFLYDFYLQRIDTHFTGSNWYGRGEDFMEQLLQTTPSSIVVNNSNAELIDPMKVAKMILTMREIVAEEWLEMALDVQKSHTKIKRWQLNKLMGRDMDEIPDAGIGVFE